MPPKQLTFTIGYAGRSVDEFLSLLRSAGVDRVVDVRALPLSRRKGFSKTPLGEALTRHDIEYVNVRSAGNPYRDAKHDVVRCLTLYAGYLDRRPGVIEEVEAAIKGRRAALLCFEAHAGECHRSVITERLHARNPRREIRHL